MLLRHTPKEIKPRQALTINPAKTCQPIGAIYAALGIHKCLPHSHGSQGCCAYHRSTLTRHYKEPIMAATSSFTEGSSVFGGQANLLQALNNIFTIYNPDVVAIHTTCLSETIGDDVPQIISKAHEDGKIPEGKVVISASTPSYTGSHITGFSNMVKSMALQLSGGEGRKQEQINIIPGWVEPSDMRELKRLCHAMGLNTIMFPDTSGVVDSPQTGKFQMYSQGGVRLDEMRRIGDSEVTIALGEFTSQAAAEALDAKYKVPCEILDLPIGLRATDRFINVLRPHSRLKVPESINYERGRLVDMITDMQQYLSGKRVALFGDPDQLVSLSEFLVDMDMRPVYVLTGTRGKKFLRRMQEILDPAVPEAKVQHAGDTFLLHQWIKNESVDLLIGNSYGKYIARDEDIPFVRYGFPITDRVGHTYFPSVGYQGGMQLLERILGVLLDRKDRDTPEESFELVM